VGTRAQRGLAPWAVVILALAGAALCAGAVVLTLAEAPPEDRALAAVTGAVVIAAPIGVGLATLARRRDRFAAVLVAAGALWSLTVLAQSHDPNLYSVGRTAAWVVDGVVVYLLLSFPSGRLASSPARVAMAATGVLIGLLYLPTALVVQHFPEPSPWSTCGIECPPNAFAAIGDTTPAFVADFVRPLREVLSVLVFLGVAAILAQRMYRAGPLLRRMLVPVLAMAIFRGVALAAYYAARGSAPTDASLHALGWVYILSLALIALSFSVGLLWRGLYATTALQRLTLGLEPQTTPEALRGALADALEDPSLQIAYRLPDGLDGWVSETATAVEPPREQRGRILTEVSVNGRRTAAIDTDASLAQDPALLQAAASYALMVLENGRLVRRLTSSIGELSASRARIVAVTDQARRRIERDVHDGAQQRLVALRIKLALESERLEHEAPQTAAELELLGAEVDETIDEVRAIAHGIYPSLLSDRGLVDALRAAARSTPVSCTVDGDGIGRHSEEIESAVYFACVGALANVGSEATRIVIRLRVDEGLRFEVHDDDPGSPRPHPGQAWLDGALDRLAAVAGQLAVEAVPGEGTRVTGSVPLP
jgi:signal transduction histidine kinase